MRTLQQIKQKQEELEQMIAEFESNPIPIIWSDGFLKNPIGKVIDWSFEEDGTLRVTTSNEPNDDSDDDFPQKGQDYWYLDEDGEGQRTRNDLSVGDKYRISIGNCFRNVGDMEKYKLRLKSMKPKYLPKKGERFFALFYRLDGSMGVIESVWSGSPIHQGEYLLGRTFETREQALEWINKYQDAWRL